MVLVEVARNDQEIFSDQTNIKKEISGNEKTEFSRTAPATRYDSTSEANSSTSGSEGEASPNRLRCRSVSPKREDTIINTTKAIYANSDSLSPSFEEEDEEAMAEMLAELGEEDVEMEEDLDESELLAAEYEAAQMEEEEMEAARNLLDMSKVIDGEEYKNLDGSINLEKKHLCDICGKGFPYLSILESHRRCHTGEKPFQCHFCDKKFAQKATLQVHERTHTGERPYKCKYCEKTFAQYGTKTVHEKSAHLGIRNYKCPKCDKCLSSPSALYTHKKTHGEKTFQCILCPKTFTLKNYLKLHVKQVHEQNERKHICHFCKKSFAYAGSLQVHVRTHTGERPYVCKYCPKAFASQGNLQSHERTHTGERPYSCTTCGRSFIQKSQLTAHEATHAYATIQHSPVHISSNASTVSTRSSNVSSPTSSILKSTSLAGSDSSTISSGISNITCDSQNLTKRSTDYVCKFCGKHYAYASSLYVHTRLHTGERPFHCNFCEKTFTNQGNMQVHQRVHTGEKPYKCESCNKSYAQKVGLKIHMEQCQGISGDSSSEKTQKNVVGNGGNCSSSSSVSFSPSSQNKLSPLPKSLAEHGLIQQQQMNMQLLSPHLSNNLNLQLANNNADADDLQLKHATEVMLSCLKSSNPSTAAAAFVALQQLQQPQSQVLRTAIPATSSSVISIQQPQSTNISSFTPVNSSPSQPMLSSSSFQTTPIYTNNDLSSILSNQNNQKSLLSLLENSSQINNLSQSINNFNNSDHTKNIQKIQEQIKLREQLAALGNLNPQLLNSNNRIFENRNIQQQQEFNLNSQLNSLKNLVDNSKGQTLNSISIPSSSIDSQVLNQSLAQTLLRHQQQQEQQRQIQLLLSQYPSQSFNSLGQQQNQQHQAPPANLHQLPHGLNYHINGNHNLTIKSTIHDETTYGNL